MYQPMFFFWGKISHNWWRKKKPNVNCTKAFLGKKGKWKSCHILMKKGHMLPYLDNEFLLVTRNRQYSKEIYTWLFVPFGECFWKTLKKKYKFTILAVFFLLPFFWKKRMSHLTTCRKDIHKRILYSQFWLNLLVDDFQFGYLTKVNKKKPWCQMKPKFATLFECWRCFQYTFLSDTDHNIAN
jgi:hypothetical protein